MKTNQIDLKLELRSTNGTSTEYYQSDEERIGTTLRLLSTPRLFSQPQLVLTSEHGCSAVPCRAIDMILARTSARFPRTFPLETPVGLLDISEFGEAQPAAADWADRDCPKPSDPIVSMVEIHTLGGWTTNLMVVATDRGTRHDQALTFSHSFELPVIPYRLKAGGMGLINPENITRVSGYPTPEELPCTALPMELLRPRKPDPAG